MVGLDYRAWLDERFTIGALEDQYPLYCKAMRLVVSDGLSLKKARCTLVGSGWTCCTTAFPARITSLNSSICTSSEMSVNQPERPVAAQTHRTQLSRIQPIKSALSASMRASSSARF